MEFLKIITFSAKSRLDFYQALDDGGWIRRNVEIIMNVDCILILGKP